MEIVQVQSDEDREAVEEQDIVLVLTYRDLPIQVREEVTGDAAGTVGGTETDSTQRA